MNTLNLKAALVFGLISVANAQNIPDAGTLFRQAEQSSPLNRQSAPLISLPPAPLNLNLNLDGDKKAIFKSFKFNGKKRINEEVLHAALVAFRNQEILYKDLHRIPEVIEEAYRQQGWMVKVYLPRQDIAAGVLTIQILEDAAGIGTAIKP